jgi:transposase
MSQPLLPDALWERIEPLLPPLKPRRFRFPGRKPLTHRQALTGILFVLRTGIRWNDLPCELGCGSGSACRKRLQAWQRQGVWDVLHHLLLEELREADKIDWSRAAVDSSSVRALGGGEDTGPSPTDRGRKGSKHHAMVDANGIPLAATVTAANVPDVKELLSVVDELEPVAGKPGRRGGGPRGCTATGRTTAGGIGRNWRRGRSSLGWRGGAPSTAAGWECTAGWRSGSSAGCTGIGSCGFGPIGSAATSTDCSSSPARSSA